MKSHIQRLTKIANTTLEEELARERLADFDEYLEDKENNGFYHTISEERIREIVREEMNKWNSHGKGFFT